MGVMSRRVVPACGSLCFFCPSMRARSRQPVKRYKKFLADIFPRNQDAEPNDRKICKLCDYASKNPLRIPKITELLEQRCYKDLRNENFGSVKVVICIHRKLLLMCKDQMPLFASSLIGISRTLLEQTRHDDMQILGCNILVEFISSQTDSTYMFNLEGIIPKLCQLALVGESSEEAPHLRSAGLQTLASMILFMGEQSHISMDFDKIISAVLENYVVDGQYSHSEAQYIEGQHKVENHSSSMLDVNKKVSSFNHFSNLETETDVSKNPSYWSRVCLCNMARLAKEATTVRRMFEPLFHHFDTENQWSLVKGLACSVLSFMQSLLDESGDNSYLLFSILVKHLDHKSVVKNPQIQIDIINVTTQLAQNAKPQASVTIIGAINDLIKHLRKCLLCSSETSSNGHDTDKWNIDLQLALEKCISQLSKKVGDAGLILDMLAVVLENIPNNNISARATVSAIYQTAMTVSSIPNVSYFKKAFPDALFHQLLLAMAHPDHETRIGAHNIFSIVLMPSIKCPRMEQKAISSETVSWLPFGSATQKLIGGSFSFKGDEKHASEPINGVRMEESQAADLVAEKPATHLSRRGSSSFNHGLNEAKTKLTSLRLSSHQVSLLLSSIWVQATSADNTPANFEAMAHTYSIALLFTRSKTSSHMALVRCFQLAFSLRSIAVNQEGGLLPSRRRSIFTLASFMLLFSARAGDLPELTPIIKASLDNKMVDPHLQLVNDTRLQAVRVRSEKDSVPFGSEEDEVAALKFLAMRELDEQQLKETVVSHFTIKYANLSEAELSSIKEQLLHGFLPDEAYPLGAPLFMETPRPCSPLAKLAFPHYEEGMAPAALTDDEAFLEPSGSQSDRKTSISISNLDILSVNQLLESVLETARQVASFPVSSAPVPYDQMKSQCEALVSCKQQKMSVLHSFKHKKEEKAIVLSSEIETLYPPLPINTMEIVPGDLKYYNKETNRGQDQPLLCSHEYGRHSLRLPPSSPYDKFLKAAGC
ncbi:protein SEMI-ROLLED LEAF 2 isoform X1 [Benincasa hispida]|uniref:protein SEMI-ROLLED LEAF 2 isoform X1 n=2 Tax=Benincasa hispida TaxID=102211 RepID=UPI00190105C0|nr:protein SEMI-ROLLED LEAF 2 isoform X1 [Benincasa hispida]XP_038885072.1 protein SEMI-ROLLED LEAF 2 isoform X1 [Benincasa hispida]XP_038885074.1 protein SEMI-ROLLED LEAF 2 isoform X1 [Benincasa hispida]XP_038885075.1 protein SEMI-ROLLED LEAF 2 isoform X1 [Benincasa hispida]